MDQPREIRTVFWLCYLLLAVTLAYSNHFRNAFHYDDTHTVVQNPYIRDLRNIPRFFTDGRTFGVLPQNRTWRPLVSASLAIDYWLGGGLNPVSFHASTFAWFLVLLILLYMLFQRICDLSLPDPRNRWVALFAVAWFGLHPAMAETINYIIQRGDLYSTLGVVAAVWVYAARPGWRKYGLYLVPFAAGVLSKPPALIFPAILFLYIWLFEEEAAPGRLGRVFRRSIPALVAAAALGILSVAMTPKEFETRIISGFGFRITQPLVALRFFRTLFIPDSLSAVHDHEPATGIWHGGAWAGFVFVAVVIAAAIACSRRRQWRPAAFGLWWFLLAFLPAASLPVSELENDHRMFFPFAGLVLGVCWPIALWIYSRPAGRWGFKFGVAALCTAELAFCLMATRQRNRVWLSDESLWYDAMVKSPRSGKNLTSYAASQAGKGNLQGALYYLYQATIYLPFYAQIEYDLGVVKGELGRHAEAEQHFLRGISLEPTDASGHTLYARWLEKQGRWREALDQIRIALNLNPDYMDTYYLLMQSYAKRDLWDATRKAASHVLGRFPSDPNSKAYLLMAAFETTGMAAADPFTKSLQTPGHLLDLSALYFKAGKFERSVAAAAEAIKLRPNYPEAYNNMAAAYRELGSWDLAIQASNQALRLKPNYEMARENLARSEEQKRKAMAQ